MGYSILMRILSAIASLLLTAASASAIDFEKEVRPLLQERCVECHGDKKQKGELRLDAKSFAIKGGHGGPSFVAGKPDESPIYRRISSNDEEERMPPKGDRLSQDQIQKIKAWIDSGAEWPENEKDRTAGVDHRLHHWSVKPVPSSFPPEAGVDYYISKNLADKNLGLAPEADRRTLIRRVSFDLTGLPPTPERVKEFIADKDPAAFEKLVEELLSSPHYGERWARHWLDIVHYADTHGFERDQLRPNAWRYRDYVIDALNTDKPYDRFLTEQIAGDALGPQEPSALIATGFLAAGPWDFVGHVETKSPVLKRAARAGDLDDIVTQVITSTMGVTINCARCHDHKIDPISQQEYYSLCAVFAGVTRAERDLDPRETKRIAQEKEKLQRELENTKAALNRRNGVPLDLADMVGGGNGYGTGTKGTGIIIETGETSSKKLSFYKNVKPNTLSPPAWDATKTSFNFIKGVFLPKGGDAETDTIPLGAGIVLTQIPKSSGNTWDAIRNGLLNAQVHAKLNGLDYNSEGHSVLGLHANGGITFDLDAIRKGTGTNIFTLKAHLGFGASNDAAQSRADFSVYFDQTPAFSARGLQKSDSREISLPIPGKARFLTLVATDGGDGISSDLLFLGDPKLITSEEKTLLTHDEKREVSFLKAEMDRIQKQITSMGAAARVFTIVSDSAPPAIKLHKRGNPEDEGAEVTPGGFAWPKHAHTGFGDQKTPEAERRQALAQWITNPTNPLTRRVLVNRLWHHHFGQGLVLTPSDFGLGGDRPSHPQLLDWLSEEFLKSGWSIKHMHRLIVNSRTYKQSSTVIQPQAQAVDSMNRLLSHQNPRRLDAETLRDSVLSVSGRLNPKRGGPGFRDFKYTEAYAPIYEYTTTDDPETSRRSIYRFIDRTTPHQFLSTLDCPDPANLTPSRSQTTTALQALALTNNQFMLLQSRHMATRIENETDNCSAAISRAFTLCFQRAPRLDERQAAELLIADNGLFALCRVLLNTNEFIYLD